MNVKSAVKSGGFATSPMGIVAARRPVQIKTLVPVRVFF